MNLTDLGKDPIPGDSPAGVDASFEPEFEALEGELQKLSSPTASGAVDWKKITSIAGDILARKSKNLLVAGYLNLGLLKTGGIGGLAEGIHVLRDMLETHWETMFPPKKRMRGRLNAVTWWMEKIDAGIEGFPVEKWPSERRDRLVKDLNFIDSFLGENMENAPILRSLTEKITALIEEEPVPEPEPAPSTAAPAPPAQAPVAPSEKPAAPTAAAPTPTPPIDLAGADAGRVMSQGLEILGQAAGLLKKENRFNPLAYRLNRIAAWMGVESLPPSSGGKTLLPPPDEQIVSMLGVMERSGNWDNLLDAAESRVPQCLFWLDLSRYAAESLERLGHAGAAEVVAVETVGYVGRLKGIENLAFSNGTPFASPETREWMNIQAERLGGGTGSSGSGGVQDEVAQALVESRTLIGENKLDKALEGFREKLERAASARERFIWVAGFCRLLLGAGKPRLLVPYIREILEMIDTHRIDRWEPGLATEGLVLAARGARLQKNGTGVQPVEDLVNRIAAINPARALEFME